MEQTSRMQKLLALLVLLIVVVMPTQWSFVVPLGAVPFVSRAGEGPAAEAAAEVSGPAADKGLVARVAVADLLLALTFALWVLWRLLGSDRTSSTWPPLAAFFLAAVALFSILHAGSKSAAWREAIQFVEYLLVGFLVFANCIPSKESLKGLLNVFALVTSVIVLYALVQYLTASNAMDVRATFGNRNVLGSYLGIALPLLFAIGLHEKSGLYRLALWSIVLIGCIVTTCGGALIAVLAAVIAISAVRSRKVLVTVLLVAALCVALLPTGLRHLRGWVPRHHAELLVDSVNLHASGSLLVDPQETLQQARAFADDGRTVEAYMLFSTIPPPVLAEYPEGLQDKERLRQGLGEEAAAEMRLPELSARYKGWYAATRLIRSREAGRSRIWLYGVGAGNYQAAVNEYYGAGELAKPHGRVDLPQFFNLFADEPDSFNQYLVIAVELGLLGVIGLVWWLSCFFGLAVRQLGAAKDELEGAVALGALGSLLGFALGAVYAPGLVRGVALPFIFIVAALSLVGREETP